MQESPLHLGGLLFPASSLPPGRFWEGLLALGDMQAEALVAREVAALLVLFWAKRFPGSCCLYR